MNKDLKVNEYACENGFQSQWMSVCLYRSKVNEHACNYSRDVFGLWKYKTKPENVQTKHEPELALSTKDDAHNGMGLGPGPHKWCNLSLPGTSFQDFCFLNF